MTGYKGGRILRIKVQDFMTYDDLEIFPKKGLNIIIGLNGSGKSSLMSAICLGLGGKPQFTGKSNQITDFIKHGKQKAAIEIELEDPEENVIIRRVIEEEKTTWFINDSLSQQNEVITTIRKYNIDVSNLCQFLPQEKVSDFSKIDQKRRLEIMIQAIGEPSLHVLFNDLKKMRMDSFNLEKDLDKLEGNRTSQVQLNERLKVEVDKHEERMKLQEDLETLKLQKMIIEYEGYKCEATRLKKEKKKLRIDILQKKKELNQMDTESNGISSSYNEKLQNIKETGKKSALKVEKISKVPNKLLELKEEVDSAKIEFQNRINEKRNQREKLENIEKLIQALQRLIEQSATKRKDLQQRNTQTLANYEKVREEISDLDSQLENIKLQINQYSYQNKVSLGELLKLQNKQNFQMEILKQRFRHTYEGVQWLEQNKNSFKSTIYLPPLLSVKILRDEDCKIIENSIAIRDLKIFICTDIEDSKRLINILRVQKKLDVNIAVAPSERLSTFKSPDIGSNLSEMGVERYLRDLFTAPEPVMCYLCSLYSLHKIPVCSKVSERFSEKLLHVFNKFFTPNEIISCRQSRYGDRNLAIRKDFLRSNNLFRSSENGNDSNIQELEASIQEKEKQIQNLTSQAKSFETQRIVLEKDQEHLRNEKAQLLEGMKKLENIEIQLKQKHELYDRKNSEIIDEAFEKKKVNSRISSVNSQRMKIVLDMKNLGLEFAALKLHNAKDIMYANILSKKLSVLRSEFKEQSKKCQELEEKFNAKSAESDAVIKTAHGICDYIKTHKNFQSLSALRSHSSIEEIEQNIIKVQAQLDLNYDDNESIVHEYQSRQQSILEIRKKIELFESKLKNLRAEIQEKKKNWLPALQSHIDTINKKFSHYYKLLTCAGEISLVTGEDPDDFAEYGLQVKLKYRDNEPFSVLSPDHHSGGERNVASVIFILSLQELTTVPFRCVDEINQGMDSSNERKMYEFIAEDAASTTSCSQYFLLTPKLLKNLVYHKDVAVHIIFNSKYLDTKLNVREHLQIAGMN